MPGIYPNPTHNILCIDGITYAQSEMVIYNQLGEVVYYQNVQTGSVQANIGFLPKGIYIIALRGNDNFTYKLVKD
jgi:hypothetical protein